MAVQWNLQLINGQVEDEYRRGNVSICRHGGSLWHEGEQLVSCREIAILQTECLLLEVPLFLLYCVDGNKLTHTVTFFAHHINVRCTLIPSYEIEAFWGLCIVRYTVI